MQDASIADPVRNVYSAGETSDWAKTNLHSGLEATCWKVLGKHIRENDKKRWKQFRWVKNADFKMQTIWTLMSGQVAITLGQT